MDLSKYIPKYHVEKGNLISLVLYTAAFTLLFINLYQPYGSRDWLEGNISEGRYFLLSSLLVLIGMCVVAISRIILYYYCKKRKRTISLGYYILWIIIEVFAVSLAFTILEITFFNDERSFFHLLKISFINTAWIIAIPYSFLWIYFSWRDKDRRLKAIAEFRESQAAQANGSLQPMINFYDSKGEIKFSVKAQDLIYIKGADNYLTVHYKDGSKIGSSMVRGTFKSVEDDLKNRGIIRCHRSYMVNRLHIKLFEKSKDGFVVSLDTPTPTVIPVSKNYVSDVFELFA